MSKNNPDDELIDLSKKISRISKVDMKDPKQIKKDRNNKYNNTRKKIKEELITNNANALLEIQSILINLTKILLNDFYNDFIFKLLHNCDSQNGNFNIMFRQNDLYTRGQINIDKDNTKIYKLENDDNIYTLDKNNVINIRFLYCKDETTNKIVPSKTKNSSNDFSFKKGNSYSRNGNFWKINNNHNNNNGVEHEYDIKIILDDFHNKLFLDITNYLIIYYHLLQLKNEIILLKQYNAHFFGTLNAMFIFYKNLLFNFNIDNDSEKIIFNGFNKIKNIIRVNRNDSDLKMFNNMYINTFQNIKNKTVKQKEQSRRKTSRSRSPLSPIKENEDKNEDST